MPTLEHVGIAIDQPDPVVQCFEDLLGTTPYKNETVASQQIRTHFLDAGSAKLEFLESLAPDSPVGRYLDNRGEGIHHLAFEVPDVDATMDELREAGYTLLSDAPQPGADDKRIFFVHPDETHGVLVEFCETTPATWAPKHIQHRGGRLALYERGKRNHPTCVLLHGAGGSTRLSTAPLLRRLEPTFHVLGIDLSGHGASSFPPDDTLTLERFTADVNTALDAAAVESTHLFGFSLGASVALQYAHSHPDRVNRLALLSPNVRWDDALVRAMLHRLDLNALQDQRPDRAERLAAQHDDPERLFRSLRSFVKTLPDRSEEAEKALPEVEHSTLVTALDEDPLFSLNRTESIYRALPNARFSVLPATRHTLADAPLSTLLPLVRTHLTGGDQ